MKAIRFDLLLNKHRAEKDGLLNFTSASVEWLGYFGINSRRGFHMHEVTCWASYTPPRLKNDPTDDTMQAVCILAPAIIPDTPESGWFGLDFSDVAFWFLLKTKKNVPQVFDIHFMSTFTDELPAVLPWNTSRLVRILHIIRWRKPWSETGLEMSRHCKVFHAPGSFMEQSIPFAE